MEHPCIAHSDLFAISLDLIQILCEPHSGHFEISLRPHSDLMHSSSRSNFRHHLIWISFRHHSNSIQKSFTCSFKSFSNLIHILAVRFSTMRSCSTNQYCDLALRISIVRASHYESVLWECLVLRISTARSSHHKLVPRELVQSRADTFPSRVRAQMHNSTEHAKPLLNPTRILTAQLLGNKINTTSFKKI